MTLAGSLLAYIQNEWTETNPPAASVHFTPDWVNTKKLLYPQVVVSDMMENRLEQWTSGGSIDIRMSHRFLVNVVNFIKTGSPGTAESLQVENMKQEVNRILMYGFGKSPSKYGGSLGALRIAMPWGPWTRLSESDVQPPMYRFELTVTANEDIR